MNMRFVYLFLCILFSGQLAAVCVDFLYSYGTGNLDNPRRIAISSDGHKYVSDDVGLIKVFDDNKNLVFTFGGGILEYPRGLGIWKSYIYILDKDTIRVFDTEGRYIFHFGNEFLKGGSHIAFSSTGNVYVTDITCSKIFVFDAEGKFIFDFKTTAGVNYGITISPQDLIYVLSQKGETSFITVFDSAGHQVSSSIAENTIEFTPRGIALAENGSILTTFFNSKKAASKIAVFDSLGNPLHEIGSDRLIIARDIALSERGLIHVVDSQAGSVFVFQYGS